MVETRLRATGEPMDSQVKHLLVEAEIALVSGDLARADQLTCMADARMAHLRQSHDAPARGQAANAWQAAQHQQQIAAMNHQIALGHQGQLQGALNQPGQQPAAGPMSCGLQGGNATGGAGGATVTFGGGGGGASGAQSGQILVSAPGGLWGPAPPPTLQSMSKPTVDPHLELAAAIRELIAVLKSRPADIAELRDIVESVQKLDPRPS